MPEPITVPEQEHEIGLRERAREVLFHG